MRSTSFWRRAVFGLKVRTKKPVPAPAEISGVRVRVSLRGLSSLPAIGDLVERLGWPSKTVGYEGILRAIVDAAKIDQVPGYVEDRRFVPDDGAGR